MLDKFPGHFPNHHTSIDALWKRALIVVDANFLLNLYRYSATTRDEIVRLLAEQKNRLWLPHQAAHEFLQNRLTVLSKQQSEYDTTIKAIKDLQSRLDNTRSHPFISEGLTHEASDVFGRLLEELAEKQNSHAQRIPNDDLKDDIGRIFHGRVGEPFTDSELSSLFDEGKTRYRQHTPPGYKDAEKAQEDSDDFYGLCRRYGDLILWKQLLRKASQDQVGLLFITDDRKEDWWSQSCGKTIGPRPELLTEFRIETQQPFHMYQIDRFLELADSKLNEQVSTASVEEIRSIQESDREIRRNRAKARRNGDPSTKPRTKSDFYRYFNFLREQLEITEHQIHGLREELDQLSTERDRLGNSFAHSDDAPQLRFEVEELDYREHQLWEKLQKLQSRRAHYDNELTRLAGILDTPPPKDRLNEGPSRPDSKRHR